MMRLLPFLFPLLLLASCDSGEPNKISLDDYEGAEGEALVRYLLKTLPPLDPAVPKVYTVVKGPKLQSTSMPFVGRMADLKLTFISGEVLTMREPEKSIVDPRSGLSPITLQISDLRRSSGDSWDAIGGWAYKKNYERRRFKLIKTPTGYEVRGGERLEGNYASP
jgi:hypothetical protein